MKRIGILTTVLAIGLAGMVPRAHASTLSGSFGLQGGITPDNPNLLQAGSITFNNASIFNGSGDFSGFSSGSPVTIVGNQFSLNSSAGFDFVRIGGLDFTISDYTFTPSASGFGTLTGDGILSQSGYQDTAVDFTAALLSGISYFTMSTTTDLGVSHVADVTDGTNGDGGGGGTTGGTTSGDGGTTGGDGGTTGGDGGVVLIPIGDNGGDGGDQSVPDRSATAPLLGLGVGSLVLAHRKLRKS